MKARRITRKGSKRQPKRARVPSLQRFGEKLPRGCAPCVTGSHCFYCARKLGKPAPAHRLQWDSPTIDHLVARSQGGTDDATNLVRACWACNFEKAGMPIAAWLGDRVANDNNLW